MTSAMIAVPAVRAEAANAFDTTTTTLRAYDTSVDGNEYLHDGYVDYDTWYAEKEGIISHIHDVIGDLTGYLDFVSKDDWAKANNFNPTSVRYIKDAKDRLAEFTKIHDDAVDAKRKADEEARRRREEQEREAREQTRNTRQSVPNGSGLTKSSGVNYHDGRKETYYSSRVLRHYRTGEWSADGDGFYRDAAGYYVVAASDMPQGAVFQGSKGACRVYDSGCAAGVTDYYVNF